MENRYYKTDDEHVEAVAEAIREEYEAIVAAGFMVQIDDPRLAMHYMLTPGESIEDARRWARRRIEVLNHALRNIPSDRVRHHTCYGINMGPRVSDMELKHLADLIITIKAGYYSFEIIRAMSTNGGVGAGEAADDKVLIPLHHARLGDVEHPDLVAERIVRLAMSSGARIIAGSDCGFASTLALNQPPEVEPEIVWTKFASLAEGARLASKALWT